VWIQRANTDLDNAFCQAFLQYPRQWAGVGVWIVLKIIIKVRVGIKVQDVNRSMGSVNRAHDRIGDSVVATKHQWRGPTFDKLIDM
jgi:hypothetical protein